MQNKDCKDSGKKDDLTLIALIFIVVVLCVILVFLIIAIAKKFARKPQDESGLEHTGVSSETESEWDSDMLLYFDVSRLDTAYGLNQRAASGPYLDRYDAVADQIKDAKAALDVLDPQSEEYADLLAKIHRYEEEQEQIHAEWESVNDEVTAHYMELLQLLCENWELDFEDWTNHFDGIMTFEPGDDMSAWK